MAQHEVKAHKAPTKPKRELRHIHIEKMANGFSVRKGYARPAGKESYVGMQDDDPPAVFNKHSKAHAHVRAAMAEMHPTGKPGAEPPADEETTEEEE